MTRSLRTRLLSGIIGAMALLLTVFSLLIYGVIRSALVEQFDTSLASVAQILAASVERDKNEIELELEVQAMPEFHNEKHPTYYEFWTDDGAVLARSPLLGTDDLVRPEGFLNTLVFTRPQEKNGRSLRAAGLSFVPRNAGSDEGDVRPPTSGKVLTLTVARDAGDLYGQLQFLRRLLLITSTAVTALSLLIAALVVRKGLNPLNSIAAEIAAITEDNLTTRIAAEHVPAEVIPIKNRLNEMMTRLEASFNKERQFNADVAHELRTPLAGIRSTLEVTLARNRQAGEYRQALSGCLEITKTMQSMVGNLLMLAGLDTRQTSLHVEQVKVAELIEAYWKSCSEKASDYKITFDNHIDPETTLETDCRTLSMIISNVLDNAVEYADKDGRIWTTASQENDSVSISVSNTGCRLTTEQVTHVFDCFWRADSSRSDAGIHCGLGLTLVRKLTEALGGHVIAELQTERTFTLRLNLPLKPKTQRH